jgi:DnaJ-class molecular chaperone
MDYYSTLGLNKGANAEEIKKAYRGLAMKHHPDRGGDSAQFQKIQEAYATLSDDQKRQEYDFSQQNPGGHQFHFHTGNNPFNDVFGNMFGGGGFGGNPFGFRQQRQQNATVSINLDISLEEAFLGKTLDAEIQMSNGRKKLINVDIPAGVDNNSQIRYQGMGEDSIPGIPPGDLIIIIHVRQHAVFKRENDNLILEKQVDVWDAMLGMDITFQTLDGRQLSVSIPQGSQPETLLMCKNEGMKNIHSGQRGNLYVKLKIQIPKNLTDAQKQKIIELKHGI